LSEFIDATQISFERELYIKTENNITLFIKTLSTIGL